MAVKTLDLQMTGTITAESDISISPPDHNRKEGRPTVMKLPEKSVWRDGHLMTTAYVPGSSIRGALRNGASRAVAEARARKGSPMTPDDFLLLAKGGIKDRKEAGTDERNVDYEAIAKLRSEQPIVSLFGAMAEKVAGRWQIGDAVPRTPLEKPNRKGRGVRSHPFQRQPDLAQFMDASEYESFRKKDARRVEANLAEDQAESLGRKIGAERKRQEPDGQRMEQWKAEQERLAERAKALREEAGGVVNFQQLLGGWEAIPAGIEMDHRMRIRGAGETELAWAFFALRRLAREGRIGAHESAGEGYFSAEYALRLAVDDGDFEAAGTLRIADHALRLADCERSVLTNAFERSKTLPDERTDESA